MPVIVFVTGATGTIGSETLRALRETPGVQVRAGVRSWERGRALQAGNVTPVPFDYAAPEGWREALQGVDALFLATPSASGQAAVARAVVDEASRAGIRRIVRLSVMRADEEPAIALSREHRDVERHLEASGLEWVFLRPNSFMQNFASYYRPDAQGTIYLPTGDGASSFVDAADVGASAAAALTRTDVAGRAFELTGPEALTTGEVAAAIGEAAGRPIRYVDVPEEATRQALRAAGIPTEYVEALLELYAGMKAGLYARVSAGVEELTGRPPRRFAEFARANASAWRV